MKNFKRFLSMFMVLVMVLSFTACKKDKDDAKEAGGADVSDVENIADAIGVAYDYTQGKYSMVFDVDFEMEEEKIYGVFTVDGEVDDGDVSANLGLKIDSGSLDIALDEQLKNFFVVTGDKLYINLDEAFDVATDVDTSFGSFGIPLPEVDKDAQKDMQKEGQEIIQGILESAFAEVEVEKEGNTFSIKTSDAETFTKLAIGAVKYVSENQDKINDYLDSSNDTVDVQEYLETILDYYREDIKKACEEMGQEMTDDMLDSLLEEVDTEDYMPEDMDYFENVDFDEILEEMENTDYEEMQQEIDNIGLVVELSLTAESDKYVAELNIELKEEDTFKCNIGCKYTFEVEDVSISEPEKVASITDIVKYIKENPDELQDMYDGLMEVLDEWGLYDYIIGGSVSYDEVYNDAAMGY